MSTLCASCDRKPTCLPAALAQHDSAMQHLLQNLKTCDLKPSAQGRPGRVVQAIRQWFGNNR